MSKGKKFAWGIGSLSTGVGAVIAMLATPPPPWAIAVLAAIAGVCGTASAVLLEWMKAPIAIGRPVKTFLILFIIWGLVAWVAYTVWPNLTIYYLDGELNGRTVRVEGNLEPPTLAVPRHMQIDGNYPEVF